jgi:hypothetical protein
MEEREKTPKTEAALILCGAYYFSIVRKAVLKIISFHVV